MLQRRNGTMGMAQHSILIFVQYSAEWDPKEREEKLAIAVEHENMQKSVHCPRVGTFFYERREGVKFCGCNAIEGERSGIKGPIGPDLLFTAYL